MLPRPQVLDSNGGLGMAAATRLNARLLHPGAMLACMHACSPPCAWRQSRCLLARWLRGCVPTAGLADVAPRVVWTTAQSWRNMWLVQVPAMGLAACKSGRPAAQRGTGANPVGAVLLHLPGLPRCRHALQGVSQVLGATAGAGRGVCRCSQGAEGQRRADRRRSPGQGGGPGIPRICRQDLRPPRPWRPGARPNGACDGRRIWRLYTTLRASCFTFCEVRFAVHACPVPCSRVSRRGLQRARALALACPKMANAAVPFTTPAAPHGGPELK